MRTTITLDSDVEALIKKLMVERGQSFDRAVNSLLRAALRPGGHHRNYSFPTYELGEPVVRLEHALRFAGELEDEERQRPGMPS